MTTSPHRSGEESQSFVVIKDDEPASSASPVTEPTRQTRPTMGPPPGTTTTRFKAGKKTAAPKTTKKSADLKPAQQTGPRRVEPQSTVTSSPSASKSMLISGLCLLGFIVVAALTILLVPVSVLLKVVILVGVAMLALILVPKSDADPPQGVVIPDRGFPKFLHRLYKLGRSKRVPTINDEQRKVIEEDERQQQLAAERAEQERQAAEALAARQSYRTRLIARQRELANLGVRVIVCVCNEKSGTKSSTAIGAASEMAENTRKRTLLFPMTNNTNTVTAGRMAGITGNAITVDDYIGTIESYQDPWELEGRLPLTPAGLGVIVEGRSSAANDEDANKVVQFVNAVDVSLGNVGLLWLDLGNDNVSRRSVALQAARIAHVLVFAFDFESPISHDTLRETLDDYRSDQGIPEDVEKELYAEFKNKDRTGLLVSTPDKVAHSIVVASKTTEPVNFEYQTRPMVRDANGPHMIEWNGTGITVPFEPAWLERSPDGGMTPYSRNRIQLETHISYLEIGVAALELGGHQQGYDIGTPMVANLPGLAPQGIRAADASNPSDTEGRPADELPERSSQ